MRNVQRSSQSSVFPRLYTRTNDIEPRFAYPEGSQQVLPGIRVHIDHALPMWKQTEQVVMARAAAAIHVTPSARAITHEAAAVLHGFPLRRMPPPIRVAIPPGSQNKRRMFDPLTIESAGQQRRIASTPLVRRRIGLADDDIMVRHGLPVTTPLRTAIDCACDMPVRESVVVVDAVMRELCRPNRFLSVCEGSTPGVVRETMLQMLEASKRRRGVRRARSVIAVASPWSESPGESVLRWLCAVSGVEAPKEQYEVVARSGNQYFLDLAWPEVKVGFEFDGAGKYEGPDSLRLEKRREQELSHRGWRLERFMWRDLTETDAAITRIRQVLSGLGVAPAGHQMPYLLR